MIGNENTVFVNTHRLPCCGLLIDAVSAVEHNERLSPGDITVCARCHSLLVFGDDLLERLPVEGELDSLDSETREMLAAAHRIIEERGTKTERGLYDV